MTSHTCFWKMLEDTRHLHREGNDKEQELEEEREKDQTCWDANVVGSEVLVDAKTWISWCKSLSV